MFCCFKDEPIKFLLNRGDDGRLRALKCIQEVYVFEEDNKELLVEEVYDRMIGDCQKEESAS